MADKFTWKKELGSGQFGEVWLAIDVGLNVERAVKVIPPSNILNPDNFFQEAQTLKATEHTNVVRVEETGELEDGSIYIAMEYLPNGSVGEKMKNTYLDLIPAKKIMIDALRGLEHAHSQGILHRDIKPANILIGNSGEGKLSDFGHAIYQHTDSSDSRIRDPLYTLHVAPEVFTKQEFSVASDIYASGVTLYRLVNGDDSLPNLPSSEIRNACIRGKYPNRSNYRYFIPKPLKIIINKAMQVNPSNRYHSVEEMRHALEKITIRSDCIETSNKNDQKWYCQSSNQCLEVNLIEKSSNNYSLVVKKGRVKKTLRHMNSMCKERISRVEAVKKIKRILQNFIIGRRIA